MTEQSSQHQIQGARQRLEEVSVHANMAVSSLNIGYDWYQISRHKLKNIPHNLPVPGLSHFKIPYHIAKQEITEAVNRIETTDRNSDFPFLYLVQKEIQELLKFVMHVDFRGRTTEMHALPLRLIYSHHYFDIRVGRQVFESKYIILLWIHRHGLIDDTVQHFVSMLNYMHNTLGLWESADLTFRKLMPLHVYQLSLMSSFQHMIDHLTYDENTPLEWQKNIWVETFMQYFTSPEGLQQILQDAVIYGQHMVTQEDF